MNVNITNKNYTESRSLQIIDSSSAKSAFRCFTDGHKEFNFNNALLKLSTFKHS